MLNIGYASLAFTGESVCGDKCQFWETSDFILIALADGLGHGIEAANAAEITMNCISQNLTLDCETLFTCCHEALTSSRGVALALIIVNKKTFLMTLGSVGNIRAIIHNNQEIRRFGASRGILGANYNKLYVEHRLLHLNDTVFLFSDGIDEFAPVYENLDSFQSMQEFAENKLTQWADGHDDASIILFKLEN